MADFLDECVPKKRIAVRILCLVEKKESEATLPGKFWINGP
jgi:hypothetical protein